MKELSIEEKAKAYDDAVREASIAYKDEDRHLKATLERIFPELKESEDKRIREDIIVLIKDWWDRVNKDDISTKEQMIAWLENQGEQKASYTTIVETGDGGINALVTRELPTDGEQKPADKVEQKGMNIVEEDMTPFQKKVFCIIDTTIEEEHGLKQVCDELLRLAHDEIRQKPAWSEEDEERVKETLAIIETVEDINKAKDGFLGAKMWLKSLKERVQLQPKQEWSEEDNKRINRIYDFLWKHKRGFSSIIWQIEEDANWLKSIKPRYTWKPSDEQMGALSNACDGKILNLDYLNSLYQDLKKLKE